METGTSRCGSARRCMLAVVASLALTACSPEDRAGEQPFAPTVVTLSAVVSGDTCLMEGQVVLSPNSSIKARGFYYGNDTLSVDTLSADSTDVFTAVTKPLEPGRYYVVAYARNGIGLSTGDTLYVEVE